ncbi:Cysteinyl-tRNA synthetase [Hordeum vulgare]|nr:Cysteinyl-tRNA synthetase [Hordeum vulgare]
MEVADPEDKPALEFNMAEADAEFAVAQVEEMVEQQAILESIQDEAEVEANRTLIRQKQAEADALFVKLDAEIAMRRPERSSRRGRSCSCRVCIR